MKGITKQMKEDEVHLWEKGGSLQKELEDFEQWMLDIVNNRKMKNQPNKIWITNRSKTDDFDVLQYGASWTDSFPDDEDIAYISVDFILQRIKELETEIENEDSIYSEVSCRFRIDELKNLIK